MTDTVHTEEYKGHKILIEYDQDAQSPREDDNFGTMVCWHRNYNLGDEQPNSDIDEWLESALELEDDQIENIQKQIWKKYEYEWGTSESFRAYRYELFEKFAEKNIMLSLYLYDHSGITMNTSGFNCRWDSGQVGFIYVSKEDILKEYGWKRITKNRIEFVEAYLKGEVSTYDQYLTGQIYGYVIEDSDGEDLDSLWGMYDDYTYDYILTEAKSTIDYYVERAKLKHVAKLKDMIKANAPLAARQEFVQNN